MALFYMHLFHYVQTLRTTVQTFYSCTRRPDICQCLAVPTPIDSMSKSKPSTPMIKPSFRIKATLCCEVIHASMHKKLGESGVRSCIMPGLPRHLVHGLNAGTVEMTWLVLEKIFKRIYLLWHDHISHLYVKMRYPTITS